jgi:putative oxidoreductase
MSQTSSQQAMLIIRIATAGNMLIHGVYRLTIGIVAPFEEYLMGLGFPPYTAWAITIFEIIAASSIIAGKWVTPLALIFCVQLLMGIILIHFDAGWFVVGGGRNGMEYSVLMIICLLCTAWVSRKKHA